MKGSFLGPGGSRRRFSADGFLKCLTNEKVKRRVRNTNTMKNIIVFATASCHQRLYI